MARISTDSTKFCAIVSALSSSVLNCVRDIVKNPPAADAYTILKDRILQYYAQSESSRLNLLLKDLQLGDKRPSHLLYEMQNLGAGKMEDSVLRTLWMQRLPINIQQIVSVSTAELKEVALIADKIHEVSGCSLAVSSVDSNNSELQSLRAEIADLKKTVEELAISRNRSSFRSPKKFRHRSRSISRSASQNSEKLCWYHQRYGKKAQKCVKPCNYTEN